MVSNISADMWRYRHGYVDLKFYYLGTLQVQLNFVNNVRPTSVNIYLDTIQDQIADIYLDSLPDATECSKGHS